MHRVFGVVASLLCALPCLAQRSTPIQILHPSGATDDQFGNSVAISGDTMIIGASADNVGANAGQGTAHVYRWTGTGWAFEATLTASDGAASDYFGNSVALSGDTAIIGAFFDDVGANADQGSAYIFTRTGTTWTQQAKLTASDGAFFDLFGISVAISGNTAIVGAYFDDVGANADRGSAYIFVRSGTIWTQQAKLTASDGAAGDEFGISVALCDDTAFVGAHLDNIGANSDQGSAYIFTRAGATWTQQAKLTASDGAGGDLFGHSVALCEETAIVGASQDDVGANTGQGSAYIFTRAGTTWTQQAKLTASDGAAGDNFGTSVALSGDTALVGAPSDNIGANTDQGSAYVFTRTGTTWSQRAGLGATDGAANDLFGYSVALSGDTAIVGAFLDDIGANINQGSAWVFSRVGSAWVGPDLKLTASDGAAYDHFGKSVAISGDTTIVGANFHSVGANSHQGLAYIFARTGPNWSQQAELTASDGAAFHSFGESVAISGDTAIVGAPGANVGANADRGAAYVFVRTGLTWTQQSKLTASDGAAGDLFGISVAISGNTVLVGAVFDDASASSDQGSAYIFTRSGTTWSQQSKLTASDGAAGDRFGESVAISGGTALVGARFDDVGANADQGSAYMFTRSGTTWSQLVKLTASDGAADDQFGLSVGLSGDTAIVGAHTDAVGENAYQGSAYIYVLSDFTLSQQAKLTAYDGAPADSFGASVAISGDTAIVGAVFDRVGANIHQGSAYIFNRSGTTWTQQAKLTASDGAAGDNFGYSVALSGDTAVVGALFQTIGASLEQGSAYFFDGVAVSDFSLAHNDTTDTTYLTLAEALLPALSGHQITATQAAFRNVGSLDSLGRSIGLFGTETIRTPSTSILTLGGSSFLAVPPGRAINIFGQWRAGAGVSAAAADSFLLGSRGILTVRTGSSLIIDAPVADLEGQTRLEQGAALTFAGSVTAIGPTTASLNSSLTADGAFSNIDTFSITSGTINTPLFFNRASTNFFGSSAVFGSFTNNNGATTTIRSGTLFVFGSLINNGTIVGTVCSGCLQAEAATPPGLDIGGSLALGVEASLTLPFLDAVAHVGGNFDCAITSNARYDMASAALQLEGSGTEQTLEVMSKDIGASLAGLDRSLAGHYPFGALEIGPSPSTVRLVDTRDNDGLGQGSCEAIYVGTLRIHAGSRLINTGCAKIYYTTLINAGVVDVPGNLVAIGAPCPADLNFDGQVDDADFVIFVRAYNTLVCDDPQMPAGCPADLDGNNLVDDADFSLFVVAYDALLCP